MDRRAHGSTGPRARNRFARARSLVAQLLADRAPSGSIPLTGMALLAGLLLSAFALVAFLDGTMQHRVEVAEYMALLLQNVAVLGAAIVLRYEWQMSRRPASGWLAVAVGFLAVQNLPFSLLLVAGSPLGAYGTVNGVATTLTGLVAVAMIWAGVVGLPAPQPNPLILAVGLGIATAGLRLASANAGADPTLRVPVPWRIGLDLMAAVLAVAVSVGLLRCRDLPAWFRRYVIAATVLLTASAAPSPDHPIGRLIAPVVGAGGVVLLLGGAIGLLRSTLRALTRRLVTLTRRAAEAEAAARRGHERAHELTATAASIAHASRLLLLDQGPAPRQRQRLVRLLDAEMERLERMIGSTGLEAEVEVSLDAVLEPVLAIHRTLGHEVTYRPAGLQVAGAADDLAEVFHVLVSNAARHAPGSPVEVSARRRGDLVEIRVCDEGPGVAPSVVGRLFQWGGRGPDSPGQGIGLQLARRLMRQVGGDLHWEPTARGACFVATTPAAPGDDVRDG